MKMNKDDTLWFVENNRNEIQLIALSKIGRVWAYSDDLHGYRIDMRTLSVFAGNEFHGKCYRTREEYDLKVAANLKWLWLRRHLNMARPANLRIEDIDAAAKMLGISLGEPKS